MLHPNNAFDAAGDGLQLPLVWAGDMLSQHAVGGLISPTAKEQYACTYCKVTDNALELTPASAEVVNDSLRALLAPMPMKCLMDKDEAEKRFYEVGEKMVTRAAKRMAAEAAAATAKEAKLMRLGGARRAWAEQN